MWSFVFGTIFSFGGLGALPAAQTAPNEFVFGNENEPETIDPHKISGVPDNNVAIQIFEGLLQHGPDWVSLLPGQAEAVPSPQDGGKKYTFKLRPNLKWSDGKALTAKDFEYSWLRAMRAETMGPYSYWLTDTIQGAKEYSTEPTEENRKKVGVRAIDDRTFEVRLVRPIPYFLHLTAESPLFPVRQDVVEKHGDQWTRPDHIVSNGPYRLSQWAVSQRIVLEKNPHYWDAANVQIERVVALPLNDKQTAVNLFRQGRLDWTGPNGAPNALVPSLRQRDQHFRLAPAFITYFYRFNVTKPPLDDVRVRQALALAIDRERLVNAVTRGGESVALALVPPKTGEYVSPSGVVTGEFSEDVKKAKALLKSYLEEKGEDSLRTLTLQYDSRELHRRIAQAVQEMWREHLGVTLRLNNLEWKVYLAAQRQMDFDISRSGWMGDYPDPATFLELFTSTSGNNHTGFSHAEYDRLFKLSNEEPNPKKRLEHLKKIEGILLEEVPITPMFYYVNFSLLRPEVQGFQKNLVDRPYVRFFSKKSAQ